MSQHETHRLSRRESWYPTARESSIAAAPVRAITPNRHRRPSNHNGHIRFLLLSEWNVWKIRSDMTAHMAKKQSHQPLHVNGRPKVLYRAGRYVVLVSLCALCYSNSIHGELVHDDVWAIVNNPDVRADSSLRKIFSDDFWGKPMSDNTSHKSYRPLCILTFKWVLFFLLWTKLSFKNTRSAKQWCAL